MVTKPQKSSIAEKSFIDSCLDTLLQQHDSQSNCYSRYNMMITKVPFTAAHTLVIMQDPAAAAAAAAVAVAAAAAAVPAAVAALLPL
jgi:hypothetical protein